MLRDCIRGIAKDAQDVVWVDAPIGHGYTVCEALLDMVYDIAKEPFHGVEACWDCGKKVTCDDCVWLDVDQCDNYYLIDPSTQSEGLVLSPECEGDYWDQWMRTSLYCNECSEKLLRFTEHKREICSRFDINHQNVMNGFMIGMMNQLNVAGGFPFVTSFINGDIEALSVFYDLAVEQGILGGKHNED